ncbi:hypothetical protein [uncultured Allomuricauda sp.]|uniref:hypothetical protein n=1 Tax=Flagellimonas sp. W118 TaxID=3410791 RepID=UPI00262DE67D|nr:hypothetical protein [uncultured Allomuricauda sp.]
MDTETAFHILKELQLSNTEKLKLVSLLVNEKGSQETISPIEWAKADFKKRLKPKKSVCLNVKSLDIFMVVIPKSDSCSFTSPLQV